MSRAKGYVAIVVACVLWGTMGVLGKFAFGYGIRPETLIALRLLISSSTLLFPLLSLKKELLKIERRDAVWFLLLAFLGRLARGWLTFMHSISPRPRLP